MYNKSRLHLIWLIGQWQPLASHTKYFKLGAQQPQQDSHIWIFVQRCKLVFNAVTSKYYSRLEASVFSHLNQLPDCHRQEVDCNYPLIDIDHTNATTSLKTFHRYYVMSQNEKRQNQVSYKAKTCLNTLPKYLFDKL